MKSTTKNTLAVALLSIVFVSGCSTLHSDGAQINENATRAAELDARAKALDAREAEIVALNQAAQNAVSQENATALAKGNLLPPNAAPGECYARVWVDAEYKTVSEKVLVSEASKRVRVFPAKYEKVKDSVLVSAASSRLETTPAVYGDEKETIKISDAQRVWRVALDRNSAPASLALLNAATKHGINLNTANPGICFHEHYVPATYKDVAEKVLSKAASEKITVVPAQYEMVEKKVVIKEASTRLEKVPAKYTTKTERIIDKPAHTVWKKGTGPIQRIDEATGEIMCLVEVPATYKTIKRRVLVSPATTRTVTIPAKYKTIKVRQLVSAASEKRTPIEAQYTTVNKRVLDKAAGFVWHEIHNKDYPSATRTGNQICLTETKAKYKTITRRVVKTPAQTRTIEIPAKYKEVTVTKLVEPARKEFTEIPAKYRNIERRELVKDGFMAWRSILCETNMTRDRIAQIQSALIAKGHSVGPNGADGVIGRDTIKAVNAFQRANNLPVDRYLNIKTVKALGVSPH